MGAGHMAERHFGNRGALFEQRREQIFMLGRIDFVMSASQHGDRAARHAGAMRGLIDAARQARDDDETGLAEIAGQRAGEFQPGAGRIARADDRNHRPHQGLKRAAHAEQGRRVVNRRQPRRVTGFS